MGFAASSAGIFSSGRSFYILSISDRASGISVSPFSFFCFLKILTCFIAEPFIFNQVIDITGILKYRGAFIIRTGLIVLLATFTSVSIPTTSAVLKVADFGLPYTGPVSASTSSTDKPNFSMVCSTAIIPNTPIRLAIKAGVSLQRTVVFPDSDHRNPLKKEIMSGSVCGAE